MKRTLLIITAAASTFMLASCGGESHSADANHAESTEETTTEEPSQEVTETAAATEEMTIPEGALKVQTDRSVLRWEGGTAGAQVYSHNGVIKLGGGYMTVEGEKLTGGTVMVDMSTISPEDPNYSDEHPASDLVGHLGSPDFFDIANHPNATFEITSITDEEIVGNMTIRGITNEERLVIENLEVMPHGEVHAMGRLTIDRQKYDVAWEHYLKDVVLSDEISLQFDVFAAK